MNKQQAQKVKDKKELDGCVNGCCLVPIIIFIIVLMISNDFSLAFIIAFLIGMVSLFEPFTKKSATQTNELNIENELDYARSWSIKHPIAYKIVDYLLRITNYYGSSRDETMYSNVLLAQDWAMAHPTTYEIVDFILKKTGYNYTGVTVKLRTEEDLVKSWFDSRKDVNSLYQLHPTEFEIFIAELYSKLGYKTERTKTSGDEGIDVFAEKDNKKYVIQVKRSSSPIGSPIIQKLYGSMAHALADYAICVSLAGYSTQARKFAENKKIELLDGDDIIQLMKMASTENDSH